MNERRLELRLKWVEVARRAKMSPQNLVRVRKGLISISWDAADGIENALLWERGSVEAAVLEGRRPAARDAAGRNTEPVSVSGPAREREEAPPGWTDEDERLWLIARGMLHSLQAELTRRRWWVMREEYLRLQADADQQRTDGTDAEQASRARSE
jgi:hypothetical protein